MEFQLPVKNFRRNKIVATLGPASDSREQLLALMEAGADVFRLNFSHGQHAKLAETITLIRELSSTRRRAVDILGDLQGPKIRTGMMRGDVMTLTAIAEELKGHSDTCEPLSERIVQLAEDFEFDGIIKLADELDAI